MLLLEVAGDHKTVKCIMTPLPSCGLSSLPALPLWIVKWAGEQIMRIDRVSDINVVLGKSFPLVCLLAPVLPNLF